MADGRLAIAQCNDPKLADLSVARTRTHIDFREGAWDLRPVKGIGRNRGRFIIGMIGEFSELRIASGVELFRKGLARCLGYLKKLVSSDLPLAGSHLVNGRAVNGSTEASRKQAG